MNPPSVNTTDSPADQSTEYSTHAHTNRLIDETSPYLLQHAHNPVNWYPWGEEALALAKKQGKPIFLSIGYSACHWCHVMERESFEDEATAKILNQHFIAIKVDREERPDIDEIYMTAVQMMTGRGGWPLSVWLTPDLEPFFGGTYFPPQDHLGMPGFKSLLLRVVEAWNKRPDDVQANAQQIVRALQDAAAAEPDSANSPPLEESILRSAVGQLARRFDPVWGGFGPPPKFPPSGAISLLLRQHPYSDDNRLMEMATLTLDRMAFGGMYDQLGGGFHRYSVDAQWLLPHFEKMLYDNAILAEVYLGAWQATHKDLYARVATETLDYILRDMADPAGGFHSAEDADSEGEEGRFYIWTLDQIKDILGDDDGTFLAQYYGVTEDGNFEGRNILHVPKDPADWAAENGLSEKQLIERLKPLRRRLLAERDKRVRPGKDDKVLTSWNAMAISALARGYQVLGDDRYRLAADRAADFILDKMVRDDGVLLHTYRGAADGPGRAKLPGYLDDYAEMANALVDLYETTFERRRLDQADRLVERMLVDFWDDERGGFFFTSSRHKNLLVRTRSFQDGAVPSGNSVAALVMLRLAKLLDKPQYHEKAGAMLASMRDPMASQPQALLHTLIAADFYLRPTKEIAIAGSLDDDRTRELLAVVHYLYLPNKILALVDTSDDSGERIPLLRGKTMISGQPAAYVCENYTCKLPVTDAEHLERLLDDGP